MLNAREKRYRGSMYTNGTSKEDIVSILFHSFGIYLPETYTDTFEYAFVRLLRELVDRSGDVTVMDWVGKIIRIQ